jgi:hypothetical protein
MLSGSITANKTDSFDGWVVTDSIYGRHCTVDDIQDAGRKTWGNDLSNLCEWTM